MTYANEQLDRLRSIIGGGQNLTRGPGLLVSASESGRGVPDVWKDLEDRGLVVITLVPDTGTFVQPA